MPSSRLGRTLAGLIEPGERLKSYEVSDRARDRGVVYVVLNDQRLPLSTQQTGLALNAVEWVERDDDGRWYRTDEEAADGG